MPYLKDSYCQRCIPERDSKVAKMTKLPSYTLPDELITPHVKTAEVNFHPWAVQGPEPPRDFRKTQSTPLTRHTRLKRTASEGPVTRRAGGQPGVTDPARSSRLLKEKK